VRRKQIHGLPQPGKQNPNQKKEMFMRNFLLLAVLAVFALPAFASEENYKNVPVVDAKCSAKVAANPDAHPRACALQCQASGYGVITEDKKFVKFDADGNTKIIDALKKSDKKDHLRVDVSGDLQGDTLKVKTITLL
jgi:hypothetical protein